MVIAQMERDMARQAAQSSQNAKTAEEANAAKATMEAQRASLDKLRQLEGRWTNRPQPCIRTTTSVDSIPDLPLEDGDQFYVPSRPIVVSVVGDVYNQGSFIQRPGKTVVRYLRDAGGPTRNADKGKNLCGSRQWRGGEQGCRERLLVGRLQQHGDDAGRHGCGSGAVESRRGLAQLQGLVADLV